MSGVSEILLFSTLFIAPFFLHFWRRADLISGASVFLLLNAVSLLAGYFYYNADIAGASITFLEPTELYSDILHQGYWCLVAFAIGALGVRVLFLDSQSETSEMDVGGLLRSISSGACLLFAAVASMIYVLGVGIDSILFREEYMTESVKAFKSIGSSTTLASAALLSLKIFSSKERRYQLICALIVTALIFAAGSSRQFPLVVLICGFAAAMVRPGFAGYGMFVMSIFAVPYCLHIALFMRGQPTQGLLPLLTHAAEGTLFADFSLRAMLNNLFLVNFPITASTATTANIDSSYIVTSINPLPGAFTDWSNRNSSLNRSTPYSSMGEWLNYGLIAALLFYASLGALFSALDEMRQRRRDLLSTLGFAMCSLASLSMLQYTTRTSMRLIYYYLAILAAVHLVKPLLHRVREEGIVSN